jgi:hypothetical protein
VACFVRYARTGHLIDFGNATYNYLDRIGQLRLTDERKWIIWQKATDLLKAEAMENALKMRAGTKLKDIIAEINKPDSQPVRAQAKRIALAQYFDELIESELELKDVLENE